MQGAPLTPKLSTVMTPAEENQAMQAYVRQRTGLPNLPQQALGLPPQATGALPPNAAASAATGLNLTPLGSQPLDTGAPPMQRPPLVPPAASGGLPQAPVDLQGSYAPGQGVPDLRATYRKRIPF